jgi:uncharacterized membrane protein
MEWTHTQRIDAPVDVVWRIATDVSDWPTYMPTVQSVDRLDDGPLQVGAQARIKQPAQRSAIWTVTQLTPGREFSWQSVRKGVTLIGTHRVDTDGQGSRNTLILQMSGPLTPILGRLLAPAMRKVLRTENACFKAQAEKLTAAASEGPRAPGV